MRWTNTPDAKRYPHCRMVHWFNPPHSIRIGIDAFLGALFGRFNDRREMQAALSPAQKIYSYDRQCDFWLDFVADTGDGWNSTYTMAWLLAQPQLALTNHAAPLRRGHVLVMGGDQVYPIAGENQYRYRTKGPFEAALPNGNGVADPHLFAIPGNHDWYDGLTSFLRVFCQGRTIGGWQTRQARSYFALLLPYRWWFLAVDTQLHSDIDRPQRDYFTEIAQQHMKPGDRVILAAPVPGWLYPNQHALEREKHRAERGPHHILEFLEEEIIRKHGGDLCLTLAGDQHHYSRYEDQTGSRHKISSGGGGAFLHGTHSLPKYIPLNENDRTVTYFLATTYPSRERSRSLVIWNLVFPFKNFLFSTAILGGLYLVHAWLLQLASDGAPLTYTGRMAKIAPSDWIVFEESFMPRALWLIFNAYADVMTRTPEVLVFPLGLLLGLALFTQPRRVSHSFMKTRKLIGGILHAPPHLLVNLVVIWLFSYLNAWWLPGFMDAVPPVLQAGAAKWAPRLVFTAEVVILGGIAAGFLFGLYLLLANRLAHYHEDAAFSSLRIQDYKHFLRLRISRGGVTVFPIGINQVPRRWRIIPANGQASRFEPQGTRIEAHLIESPILIQRSDPRLAALPDPEGVGFAFQETMAGWFSLHHRDPEQGAVQGKSDRVRLTLSLTVHIDNLDRFICDERHSAVLHGQIICPALSTDPIRATSGLVRLFDPVDQSSRKLMTYELGFSLGNQEYLVAGDKFVEDNVGVDFWSDTTTLFTRLHRGTDRRAPVEGAGILRITPLGLLRQVASMRAINAPSGVERIQAFGVFLQFFANEMWDTYFKRAKAFSFKTLLLPWLALGSFYVAHTWALGADVLREIGHIAGSQWLSPWYCPAAIRVLSEIYMSALAAAPATVALPLALWLGLSAYSLTADAFPRLDSSARLGRVTLSAGQALVHVFFNVALIWLFIWINVRLGALGEAMRSPNVLVLEMLLIGGYVAGLLFRVLKQLKLRRPYVG
jgi:hypothetical protein